MLRNYFSKMLLVMLALAICTGTLQAAATITANSSTIQLYCDTVLGSAPADIGIKLLPSVAALTVTVTAPAVVAPATSPVVLPSPAALSVSSSANYTNFSVRIASGCKGATQGQTVVFTFTPSGASPTTVTVTATLNVTNSGTALAPSPSAVNITCIKGGAAGSAQTVNVTSPANGGTPFTVDQTGLPGWLTVGPAGGGSASATPVALTVTPIAPACANLPVGNTSFSVQLLNPPAPPKSLPVTVQVGAANTLVPSPTSISLSYTKNGSLDPVTTNITAPSPVFFTVDATSLPLWLNVTPTTATATTVPSVLTFTPTNGAKTLAVGAYSANVRLKSSGNLDLVIPVTLQVRNQSGALTVTEGTARTIDWVIGTTLPSLLITPISADPISYVVTTTAGGLSPQVSQTKGIAYSFGSPFTVTFPQAVLGAAAPGPLTASVTITPASGSAVTVNITVNVRSPGAAISAVTPASIPTATSGTFTVALSGSGFVVSADPLLVTKVGVVSGGFMVSDANISASVVNSTTIVLTITVPASADPFLPFGAGGTVPLGVCNPQGSTCSVPTGTATLTIGVNPIVQAVTSASSYKQATPPALTPIAPYDIISIFGTNFCISGGTGCLSTLYGTADPGTLRYPTWLASDSVSATQRKLTVTFQTHAASPAVIASAPLLFATNNQINFVVPDALKTYLNNTVDIVVSFGYGTGATLLKSTPYPVTIAATNPGIFAVGGAGQGDAAALMSPTYALVTNAAPAGARNPNTDSDVIQLYVTGLGVPDSVDGATAWTTGTTKCMAVDSYWAGVNTATSVAPALTSADGLVMQSSLLAYQHTVPCIKSSSTNVPTVTIDGVQADVLYAGWVPDSVAGLYQINVQIPASDAAFDSGPLTSGTVPVAMPIIVTAGGKSSQLTGVNLNVLPRLKVEYSGQTDGQQGVLWTGSAVVASEGTGPYTYAVTSGSLPTSLTLAADGTISGTPSAGGTYTFQITATDAHAAPAWKGTVSVTSIIAAP